MSLIPLHHVVADELPVSDNEMLMGSFVGLDVDGNVVPLVLGSNTAGALIPLGIAGDTKSDSQASLPSTNGALIHSQTTQTPFVNRVSDMFDETKAAGLMTVYYSGGKFATNIYSDQDTLTADFAPGDLIHWDVAAGLNTSATGTLIASVLAHGEYGSGVPGTDIDGDISLGEYVTVKLAI
jgi:hypothetical protein